MEKRHRVFVAINLPGDVKKVLTRYQEKWPDLPAKWTNKDNLHITLEFLGGLTDIEIADVCRVVGEVAENHNSFSIDLNKILYGPPKKMPPRMVWVQGEKSEELINLKKELQEFLLEAVRFRPDGKGFSPHINLARIKEWEFKKIEPEERPEIEKDISMNFKVTSIDVMESKLKREGPQYVILEKANLIS